MTSGYYTLTKRHGGKDEASEEKWMPLCRRSAQQSKLYEHQLHARYRDAPIYRGSRCEREMVEICAAPPSRFSKSRFQSMPHCACERGCYENSLAFTLEGMANTKRNKVLIKGSIPTIHAVVSEVSEELTDRKKRQVSSDFQSSFDKVKRNRSEFIIFWL